MEFINFGHFSKIGPDKSVISSVPAGGFVIDFRIDGARMKPSDSGADLLDLLAGA